MPTYEKRQSYMSNKRRSYFCFVCLEKSFAIKFLQKLWNEFKNFIIIFFSSFFIILLILPWTKKKVNLHPVILHQRDLFCTVQVAFLSSHVLWFLCRRVNVLIREMGNYWLSSNLINPAIKLNAPKAHHEIAKKNMINSKLNVNIYEN